MKAVIFDWDGVVIDSSAQHERSWEILAKEISKPLPDGHFLLGFGKKNALIIPEILVRIIAFIHFQFLNFMRFVFRIFFFLCSSSFLILFEETACVDLIHRCLSYFILTRLAIIRVTGGALVC